MGILKDRFKAKADAAALEIKDILNGKLAPGARLAHVVDAAPSKRYLFANSGGYGFIAKAEELLTRMRDAGASFVLPVDGEMVLVAESRHEDLAGGDPLRLALGRRRALAAALQRPAAVPIDLPAGHDVVDPDLGRCGRALRHHPLRPRRRRPGGSVNLTDRPPWKIQRTLA